MKWMKISPHVTVHLLSFNCNMCIKLHCNPESLWVQKSRLLRCSVQFVSVCLPSAGSPPGGVLLRGAVVLLGLQAEGEGEEGEQGTGLGLGEETDLGD